MKSKVQTRMKDRNVWVMVVTARPYQRGEEKEFAQQPDKMTPTHRVRFVLRTTDNNTPNPYVDGSDFYLAIDEQHQSAEFVWEEDSFGDAPLLHGSEILTAIHWASELSDTLLSFRIENPFQVSAEVLPITRKVSPNPNE